MTFEQMKSRDNRYKVLKKKYKNLSPIAFIPNSNGYKLYIIDINEIFHPVEVYIRNGSHKIKFIDKKTCPKNIDPFQIAIGWIGVKEYK